MDDQSSAFQERQAALRAEVDRLLTEDLFGSTDGSLTAAVSDALVSALVEAVRRQGLRIEQLVLAIKRAWSASTTPYPVRHDGEWARLGDVLVTRCIDEFYRAEATREGANPAGEAAP